MRYPFFIIITLFSIQAFGQYYTSGSDPARLKWRQIKTPTVRLVFEQNFEREALRLAAFMDSVAPLVSAGLNHKPKRINMLVHNQTGYSNGFVSWAPKRVELYSVPNQNITSIDWLEHLALHEYRHVVQIDQLNRGFTRFASVFLGQQATGGVLGLYLPMWFLEGDAIVAETSLTNSGRGRSYSFNQELKAQLVNRGPYSYDKAYMGSYRNQVPNYYQMGYPLTAMVRNQYGEDVWGNAIKSTGQSFLWIPNPFRLSLKKQTGLDTKKLYNKIFSELQTNWQKETQESAPTLFNTIVDFKGDFANFNHPVAINDTTLICELDGPGLRSQIVEINTKTGQQKTIIHTGNREPEPISANENYVVWSELKSHVRWENESFSIIRIFNRQTGKTKQLTRKTKFFSPAIHPTKPLIAAVEATTDYRFFLVILDAGNGEILQRIVSPGNQYILTPSWNRDGSNVVAVLQGPEGKSICAIYPESGKWEILNGPSYNEVRHPVQDGNEVCFSANGQVSEEIFHLKLPEKVVTRLTSSKFGAAHPSISPQSKKLIYSHYTDNGYRPVIYNPNQAMPNGNPAPPSVMSQMANSLAIPALDQEKKLLEYKTEPYSKLNLLGLHSWGPIFSNYADDAKYSVFGVMSQNLLGTAVITAGYNADPAFTIEKYQVNLSYRGLFPILDLDLNFGDSQFNQNGFFSNATDTFEVNVNQKLNHFYLKAGMRLPFNLSAGKFSRQLEPGVKLTLEQQTGFSYPITYYTLINNKLMPTGFEEIMTISAINYISLENSLFFYNIRRGSSRDVSYRMGQVVHGIFRHTPMGTYKAGWVFGIHTKLYLPGLAKHHAIGIDNDWQTISNGDKASSNGNYERYYRLSILFSHPRGYSSMYSDDLYIFRSTYMMPLWNPDVALAGLAYIKRLRLNVFHDAAVVKYKLTRKDTGLQETFRYTPTSTGLELHADTHFFRFILPFSVGYRIGYRNMDNSLFQDFILSTSFGGFLVNGK
jgi:hypothetical protein